MPRKPAILDFSTIADKGACEERYTFQELFGESAEVTVEKAREVADRFEDWNWPVNNLLPQSMRETYNKFSNHAQEKIRVEMQEALLKRDYTPSGKKRVYISDKLNEQYRATVDKLQKETRELRAVTWAKLYIQSQQNNTAGSTDKAREKFNNQAKKLVKEVLRANAKEAAYDSYSLSENLNSDMYTAIREATREYEREAREARRQRNRPVSGYVRRVRGDAGYCCEDCESSQEALWFTEHNLPVPARLSDYA